MEAVVPVKSLQSCPTLCNPVDCSLPGSTIRGTLPGLGRSPGSGLPCPLPGDLPNPGIEPASLTISCIGRWILYHYHHLERPLEDVSILHSREDHLRPDERSAGPAHTLILSLNNCYKTPSQILLGWTYSLERHEPAMSPFIWQSNKATLLVGFPMAQK